MTTQRAKARRVSQRRVPVDQSARRPIIHEDYRASESERTAGEPGARSAHVVPPCRTRDGRDVHGPDLRPEYLLSQRPRIQ
jgi:hypothetical protein